MSARLLPIAAALSRGAMPSLQTLGLAYNKIGDQGLIALAAPLRQHPALAKLDVHCNEICDEGVAALVAPGEGVLPKLCNLYLSGNPISDIGCTKLVDALDGGTTAKLAQAFLVRAPASAAAKQAVQEALDRAKAARRS